MTRELDRRTFLAATAAGVGTLALRPGQQQTALFVAPPLERVRMAFVGVGHQGSSHIANFLRLQGVDIVARAPAPAITKIGDCDPGGLPNLATP